MTGMNFLGSYSGIDKTTIDQLMAAEKMPLVQLSNKKIDLTAKQNAWKDVNTRLNSLFEKVKTLQNSETFTAKSSTSTNDDMVTMTASKNALPGTYKIEVQQLASSTSVISGEISLADGDITKELGIIGEFTIKNNDFNVVTPDINNAKITIVAEDTLKTIATKINDATKDTGINATIIDSRLVLSDGKTGNRNITLTDGDGTINGTLGKLGFYDNLDGLVDATEPKIQQGTNAKFTINGVAVERSTNTVSDAVEFVTINLNKAHTAGQYDTVKVSLDTTKLTTAVQEFVDQYNSTMTFIEDKLAAGDSKVAGSRGALAGDSGLMRLHSSLRNLVTSELSNGNTDIKDISQLGVSTIDKFGQLKFDSTKLTGALSKNAQNVMNFFTSKDSTDKEIGFAPKLKIYVDSFISTSNGIIKGKTDSFDRTLKDLTKQITRFNARMVKKEAYYIKMYSALDTAMMKSESQSSWLQGQIESMNGSS